MKYKILSLLVLSIIGCQYEPLDEISTPIGGGDDITYTNPFQSIDTPNYLDPSHYTRIPYLHTNYEDMYNTYGIGLIKNTYTGPPRDAVVMDYNGDGYYDLVHSGTDWRKSFTAEITDDDPLGNQYRNKIQFFYGDEYGRLTLDTNMSTKYWGMLHGYKGNVNDYNNDGIPDILFAGTGWHGPSVNNAPAEYLNHEYPTMLLSDGIGNYTQVSFYELSQNYDHSVSSGDYDNDGDVDIIFIDPRTTSDMADEYPAMRWGKILKNKGNGTFDIIDIPTSVLYTNQKFTSELVDVNGDGFLDLILGGTKKVGSHILLGDGVDFNNEVIEIPGVFNFDFAIDFTIYDYDSDGDKDIIVNRIPDQDSGEHYEGWYIQILQNKAGSFTDYSTTHITDNSYFGGDYWINFIHIADFDNDGIVELFNNTIDRNSDWRPCDTCPQQPKLEWELIDGKFIKK